MSYPSPIGKDDPHSRVSSKKESPIATTDCVLTLNCSAGGGGAKSEHRNAKIQAKNEKLNEERQRQAKDIQKDKKKHDKKAAPAGGSGANAAGLDGAADDAVSAADNDQWAGLHPSRRGRV